MLNKRIKQKSICVSCILQIAFFVLFIISAELSIATKIDKKDFNHEILSVVDNNDEIVIISNKIWNDVIGKKFTAEIDNFKKEHHIPFAILNNGQSWNQLKRELDVKMTHNIQSHLGEVQYSWEEFRNMNQIFKEKLINKVLKHFHLNPVKWQFTGTLGYNSDIDNVIISDNSFDEVIAKILADTLNVYMYSKTSDIIFDVQTYTRHPADSLNSIKSLQNSDSIKKYQKIEFALSQLQIYRNISDSNVISWNEYKKLFTNSFPKFKSVLKSIDDFENSLHEALEDDIKFLKSKYPSIDDRSINNLIDLKAIAIIARQIKYYEQMTDKIKLSLENHKKSQYDDNEKVIVEYAIKEKDDLLTQLSLLFAIRGSYFPESYYTQESFKIVVSGDQHVSQILTNMVNDAIQNNNEKDFNSISDLRDHIVKSNPKLFSKSTEFTHAISLGEQLGYFLHKLSNKELFTPQNFLKGAKYFDRFVCSFNALSKFLRSQINHLKKHCKECTESDYKYLDPEFNQKMRLIADRLILFYRYKISFSKERVFNQFYNFIKENSNLSNDENIQITKNISEYLFRKAYIEPINNKQKIDAFLKLFRDRKNFLDLDLDKKLDIRFENNSFSTNDTRITLILNALLGKSLLDEDPIITKNFDSEFSRAARELNIDKPEQIKKLIINIVKGYISLIKMFFSTKENTFDEYSLNYQEINFYHSFDPKDIIIEDAEK